MYILKSFRETIKHTFYDKTINIISKESTIDDVGGVINATTVIGSFKGNVNVTNFDEIQKEYGLDLDINIAITTDYDKVHMNNVLEYEKIDYEIKSIIKNDSHVLIIGVRK